MFTFILDVLMTITSVFAITYCIYCIHKLDQIRHEILQLSITNSTKQTGEVS